MRAAVQIAMASSNVTADLVEVSEFPDLIDRFRVSGVPKTVFNDRLELVGAAPEAEFVEYTLRAGELG